MNTNAYFEIGSSHRVCEDYALAGTYNDMAYAIVSDGCSSSNDTDIGARLLATIAKGVLKYLRDRDLIGAPDYNSIFRELVVRKCIEVKQSLGIPTDAFDATLLVSALYQNKIISLGWGDGYFIFVTNNNVKIIYDIHYSSGAPYYLSYEMSPSKKEAYKDIYGQGIVTVNNLIIASDGSVTQNIANPSEKLFSESLYKEAYAPNMKFIILSSDGIGTYQDDPKFPREDGSEKKTYDASEIIPQIAAYKNIAGEFVVRRMQRIKSDMDKNHIIHIDDVSCASLALDN